MKIFYIKNKEFGLHTRTENKKFYLIGSYLESDIQSDEISCQEIITYVEEVKSGKRKEWQGSGNAHILLLKSDFAYIQNMYLDDPVEEVTCNIEAFEKAIRGWLTFITDKSMTHMEVDLGDVKEVEFY
ncbi:MAG: YacL family protein [Candidatus Gracilibacteria bacterium]|nr:YacL family protein [Candidatus Gracilibacteria bacterium]